MDYGSKTLEQLVRAFSELPGVGEKSAQRIALFLIREGQSTADFLIRSLQDLKEKIGKCSICFNLTDEDPCSICGNPKRNHALLCVVEDAKDLLAIERSGGYRGVYHVLGGVLSPLDGVGEQDLEVQSLMDRLDDSIQEVILATNPTVEGEMTAAHLARLIKERGIHVTRIARGVPFGGTLEFNDPVTLSKAFEGRSDLP